MMRCIQAGKSPAKASKSAAASAAPAAAKK
jgi:hypothetical protein